MINIDLNRNEKTKRWKIPEKFLNLEFTSFLNNAFPIEISGKEVDKVNLDDIKDWIYHFQLWELHGIDVTSILKLLSDKGCAKIFKKNEYIQYHHQNLAYLQSEIRARIT